MDDRWKASKKLSLFTLLGILMLSACAPTSTPTPKVAFAQDATVTMTSTPTITPTATPNPTATNIPIPTSTSIPKPMGDVYILTSRKIIGSRTHMLWKISSDCFIKKIDCPNPEFVSTFPKDYFPPYVIAPMYWSPNGKYLFSINNIFNYPRSTYQLFSYDVQTDKTKTIISGYEWIDDLAWNPNNKWAAITLGNLDNHDVQIILINPEGEKRILPIETVNEGGNLLPFNTNQLNWIDENELIFIRQKLADQSDMSIERLFKFNILTSVETEIQLPLEGPHYIPSPNGSFAFFVNQAALKTYDFKTKKVIDFNNLQLNQSNQYIHWSPDSKLILVCDKENTTYVVTPNLGKTQKIIEGCTDYYAWMPDGDHIILLFLGKGRNSSGVDEDHWYFASISANTVREVIIPELDLKTNYVDGIYVQPVKP